MSSDLQKRRENLAQQVKVDVNLADDNEAIIHAVSRSFACMHFIIFRNMDPDS